MELSVEEEMRVGEIEGFFLRIVEYQKELAKARQEFEDTLPAYRAKVAAWKKLEREASWREKDALPPYPTHPEGGAYLVAQGNLVGEERYLKEYASPESLAFLLGLVRRAQFQGKLVAQIQEIMDPPKKEFCSDCNQKLPPDDIEFYENEYGEDRNMWDTPYCSRCAGEESDEDDLLD